MALAPHLVGKVAAVGYGAETRTLQLLPSTRAYATQLNLYQRDIVAKINNMVGLDTVRKLEVLRLAVLTSSPSASVAVACYVPADSHSVAPASAGRPYRIRAAWTSSQSKGTQVSAAAQRQIRERMREPEERFGDGLSEMGRLRARATTEGCARASDAVRARALRKLAEERAERTL
ncbi:hypothetical protein [Streptomyces sp. ADI97-07]|uniref:hypothetical protein n=1 Tax=Streptomyces sp. ADI97-07 TaxID=1522762 RepID=UPI000F54D861|nr:hypothetical protein [Streptomyces sp. ADI97-07]